MSTPVKASQPLSTEAIEKTAIQPTSTSEEEEASRLAWRLELGRKMVEAGNRMDTDPEYRRKIRSMTR
uniref:hypothetical protein n=1 Tax=Castellaniella defragrans TaxID=75697 RepID=UPI0033425BDF